MPETDADTCPLIDPNDKLAPLRRNDGSLNTMLIGIIVGVILLVIIIVVVVVRGRRHLYPPRATAGVSDRPAAPNDPEYPAPQAQR